MRGGHLRRVVTLESPSETSGDVAVTWTVVATVGAEMLGLGGSEASGIHAEADYRFRIRFRSDLTITPRWRLGLGATRKFNITSVVDPTGRREELVIVAREIV